ncbi:hypothetical protein [Arthrobacter sp.]|uniref:hypothetical protein n=1 Tax=Arthrobacter sp. TaxID=1667 RepID=UPI003394DF20
MTEAERNTIREIFSTSCAVRRALGYLRPGPCTADSRHQKERSMKHARSLTVAAAAAVALLLSGCGGPPADGGSFANVTELKDAFVKAGGTCDNWSTHNKSILAATAGSCGDKYAFAVYDDMDNMATWVDTNRVMKLGGVVGKNWTISCVDPSPVHDKLGGELLPQK